MVPNKLALSKVANYTWYMHASKLEMPTAMQYDSSKQVITCPLGFPLGPFSMKSDIILVNVFVIQVAITSQVSFTTQ